MLLLASLGRGAKDFAEVAPLVAAAGFRVLCPDPRGIGRSAGPMEGLTLYDLAEDAAAVLEAEGTGPAIIAGHAFGNWVARALSAARPALVRGVVLLAASVTTNLDPAVRASIDGSFDPALSAAERLGHLQRGYFAPGHDASVWLYRLAPAGRRDAAGGDGGDRPALAPRGGPAPHALRRRGRGHHRAGAEPGSAAGGAGRAGGLDHHPRCRACAATRTAGGDGAAVVGFARAPS